MIKYYFRQLAALVLLLICASPASAWDVYGDFASGNWWQEVGYAGVGNKNEVLAVAEVALPVAFTKSNVKITASDVGTIPRDGTFTDYELTSVDVNSVVDPRMTVQFRLKGFAADADYVGKVKLWARKYDATAQSSVGGSSQVANTFAYPFDYRDPVGKSGAILLYETSDINSEVYTCEVTENLTGNYVLYITADVKEIDTNPSAGMLPLLTVAKTELGADFVSIQTSATSVDYTATYSYTYSYRILLVNRTGTVYDKTKTGTLTNINTNVTLTQVGKPADAAPNGSRVLVPQRKVLYTPGDFYSKYYRIPCLAKASDGSLIAISDARKYHIHDIANDIDMIARRSTDGGKTWSLPITIAKGDGGSAGMSLSECKNTDGYGDAAIAALPNGDLIVTMIYGNGLGDQNGKATENYYCISHDNGQSWSAPKEINPSLTNSERGCIAPGNMCVVKEGYLAGKVIGCFRSYATSGGTLTQNNYFLVYDPATDSWSRLTINDSYTYRVASGTADDEGHLIEVAPNTFLYSVRQSNRAYAKVVATSATAVTATSLTSNMSGSQLTSTACNGDMLNYTTKAGNYYQIHSLPVRTLGSAASGSGSGRNGLKLITTQYTGSGNLNGTTRLCLSDPYDDNDYRKETAQYSSMTQLSDGSVGIFFEEYPQVIRVDDGSGDRGDFLMEDVYMNLRIGDIIPNEEAPEAPQLKAPRITPTDRSYDSHQPTDRPNPITIYNDNEEEGVTTHYTIYFYDENGHQAATSISGNFTGASTALDWSTLVMGNQSLEDMVKDKQYPGVSIRVIAYCTKDGFKDSESVAQPYLFSTPVRNVKIVAKPVSGWGTPFISAFNIGTYEQDQVMVASVGATLVANGTPVYPYSFKGFSFNGDQYVDIRDGLTSAQLQALNIQDITDYQITMTVPYLSEFPNNEGEAQGQSGQIVIYAWYEANNDFGVKTRVLNNYYSSLDDENKPYYFRNDWYPNLAVAGEDFPDPAADLLFDNVNLDKKDNAVPNPIYYNLNPQKVGLDLNVEIMPDNRAMMGYNAIVMVKNIEGDYVKVTGASSGSMAKAPAVGSTKYFLLQGKDVPFAQNSAVYTGATAVQNWYEESANGILPVHVEGIAFDQVVAKNVSSEQAVGACNFNVEIYFVRGNSLANVEELTNSDNYVTRVIHPVRLSNNPATGVQDNMVTRTVKSVRYFNLAGMVSSTPFAGINIVVTDYTDGTRATSKVLK